MHAFRQSPAVHLHCLPDLRLGLRIVTFFISNLGLCTRLCFPCEFNFLPLARHDLSIRIEIVVDEFAGVKVDVTPHFTA